MRNLGMSLSALLIAAAGPSALAAGEADAARSHIEAARRLGPLYHTPFEWQWLWAYS